MPSRKSSPRAEQLGLLESPGTAKAPLALSASAGRRGAATPDGPVGTPGTAAAPAPGRRKRGAPALPTLQLDLLQPTLLQAALVAGVDEAGRGPLAGPVVAAAVILDDLMPIPGLADSKVLTARRREALYDQIRARALACCIAEASVEEIDRLNILHATMLAMQRAVAGLRLAPQQVLVDGNRVPPDLPMPALAIVKGDALVASISAASILAKVHRDRLCADLHQAYPMYGFATHKGYPTADHLAALRAHGACPQHRRSYAPVRAAIAVAGIQP